MGSFGDGQIEDDCISSHVFDEVKVEEESGNRFRRSHEV